VGEDLREDGPVTEPKTPLEQALDLFVYFPVGLALTAREEVPRFIEKGRQKVGSEVTMARAVGQFAVIMGQKEAEKAVRAATTRRAAPPRRTGGASEPTSSGPATAGAAGTADRAGRESSVTANGSSAALANGEVAPPVASLAIPGYDTLSASQVVQRLAGLAPAELEAVRSYEAATRQRRTILTKVAQLQGGAAG
jgi:hypothetical protein